MIEDSGLLQHPKYLALFLFLLLKATWKPYKYATSQGLVHLKIGQVVTGRDHLSRTLKQSAQTIRSGLKFLTNAEIITIKSTNHYSIITIVNYAKYQLDDNRSTSKSTSTQPAPNQHPTTEEAYKHNKHYKTAFKYFEDKYQSKYKIKPRPSKKAMAGLNAMLEEGLAEKEWQEHVDTFFEAPWPQQKHLGGLMANWDQMAKPAAGVAGKSSKDLC